MTDVPAWRRRFTAPVVRFPQWSQWAPHRLAMVSNEGGSFQAWTVDLAGGERRRVSDEPVGVEEAI
ncbi:MAG: S9 family peptidase, partial [Actinobacteria bacterium]|nr:S9 family peptidase [Actinomycetota bacterium]